MASTSAILFLFFYYHTDLNYEIFLFPCGYVGRRPRRLDFENGEVYGERGGTIALARLILTKF